MCKAFRGSPAPEIQIFLPLITISLPSCLMLVWMLVASELATSKMDRERGSARCQMESRRRGHEVERRKSCEEASRTAFLSHSESDMARRG
jgi:hypothetical protein